MKLPKGSVITSNYSGLAKINFMYEIGALSKEEMVKFRKRALRLGWNANSRSLSDASFAGLELR